MNDGIDTTTGEGFRAGRELVGLSDSALGILLGVDRRKIRRWEAGDPPPHPTAAAMLRGLMTGYRPPGARRPMTGHEFRGYLSGLGLSHAQAAEIVSVDEETIDLWTSDDRGPNPIAVKALEWWEAGWTP